MVLTRAEMLEVQQGLHRSVARLFIRSTEQRAAVRMLLDAVNDELAWREEIGIPPNGALESVEKLVRQAFGFPEVPR